MFWKLDARCFLCSPHTSVASDNKQCRAVGDCLIEHNVADVCGLMVLIYVNILWKYEYGSGLDIFPALSVFRTSALYVERKMIIQWMISMNENSACDKVNCTAVVDVKML